MAYHEFMNDEIIAPSPSESNISELETALRERESELAHLRRTMEHNEKVIFKVHQVVVMRLSKTCNPYNLNILLLRTRNATGNLN